MVANAIRKLETTEGIEPDHTSSIVQKMCSPELILVLVVLQHTSSISEIFHVVPANNNKLIPHIILIVE